MEVAPAMDNSGSAKRRKVGNAELMLPTLKPVRITGRDSEDAVNTTDDDLSFISGDPIPIPVPALSCCSIDGAIMEKLKYADLEESAETEATVRGNLFFRTESPRKQIKTHSTLSPMAGYLTSPTTEFKPESGELQPPFINSRQTPPAAELEEFFAAAEKDIQNRFKNKYNYDIVNDVPLKGRYEWIQLKP